MSFAPAPPFVTAPDDVGLVRVDKIGAFWFAYFVDTSAGLFARLTFGGNERACAKFGGRLPTPDEIQEMHDAAARGEALELAPHNLPDQHLCSEAGVVLDWATEPHASIVAGFLQANMGGRPWAEYHEGKVQAELVAKQWDGSKAVVGIGKVWTRISPTLPPTGRAYLFGWWDGRRWIQPRPNPSINPRGPHGAEEEHDYGTESIGVWDVDPMTIDAVVAALALSCVNPYTGASP